METKDREGKKRNSIEKLEKKRQRTWKDDAIVTWQNCQLLIMQVREQESDERMEKWEKKNKNKTKQMKSMASEGRTKKE